MAKTGKMSKRAFIQWSLVPLVFVTIGLGWKYPLLGFLVPVVMTVGIVGGMLNGRYVCGNLCPRGAFFDRLGPFFSRSRAIPNILRNKGLRWTLFAALMSFMVYRISLDPGNPYHWGSVFWLMCTITTAAGVALAIFIHPRSWCSICPVGTAQNAVGGHKNQLQIDADACRSCGLCTKVCPMALSAMEHKEAGVVRERDCLKCSECVARCPVKALSWPKSEAAG